MEKDVIDVGRFDVFIVNFKQISLIVLLFPSLTWDK